MANSPKVILLCGGKGERLRPLTSNTPKPLIPLNNKPILSYIFEHLEGYKLNDFIIATGYKAEKIDSFMDSIKPSFSYKTVNLGNADIIQRIKGVSKFLDSDFMVLYGDTLSDLNINNLIKFHKNHKCPATISVWPLKTQFGLVEINSDDLVTSFQEKPVLDKWINIGYFYFDRDFMDIIAQYSSFEDCLIQSSIKGLIAAYRHEGIHITINTLRELQIAEEELEQIEIGYK